MNWKEYLVLYVDDEWANRVVFEQAFGGRYRVMTLGSAREALEVLKREPVAAVLTDQRMPEMSGHDLLVQVKAMCPETVRVVITAYSDLDPILRAINEGLVARYVIKPWDRAELDQLLLWAIEAYALGQESSALQFRLMQTERLVTLGSIAAAMMHDFNQPLSHVAYNTERLAHLATSMEALTQLVVRADGLSEVDRTNLSDLAVELPEITREMLTSCEVFLEMTKSMRQFLQPNQSLEPSDADPVPIVRYALSVCREIAVRAQGRLAYEGPEALPRVAAGSTELTQVLINLVSNGAQALLRRDAPGGRVIVRVEEVGAAVRFTVVDDGPGMSPELLQKIGTPFFSTRLEGTGLGVVQCRRLIERLGGELRFSSTEGVGTTATFAIPKASADRIDHGLAAR